MIVDEPYSPAEVADRLAIEHVLSRYVHALDARRIDELDDVFLPDAVFDLTSAFGLKGTWRDDLKEYFKTSHTERFVRDFHLFSNIKIEFDDPEHLTARTSSKVFNPRAILDDEGVAQPSVAVGVYYDFWRKTPVGWRIAERRWERAFILGD